MTRCFWGFGFAAMALLPLAYAAPATARSLATMLTIERARPVAPFLARDAFVYEPALSSVTLSPDGRSVAFLRIAGGRYSLWLQSTAAGGVPRRILSRTDAREILWSRDSRWLTLIAPDKVQMVSPATLPGSGLVATLGGPTDLRLLDIDPWHTGALLVDHSDKRWRLWHAGPGGVRQLVATSDREIVDVAPGRDGQAAFLKLVDGDRHLIVARMPDGRFRHVTNCIALERCDLIGTTLDGKGAYIAGDLLSGRRAILQLDADGHRTLIHTDPSNESDVDDIVFDRQTGEPEIASYRGSRIMRYGLNTTVAAHLTKLKIAPDSVIETSSGAWLIRERDARLQGHRWHLFDPDSGALRLVLDDHAGRVPTDALASTLAFSFIASDGMAIHGLLSVPPGRDLARVPLVTIVHGGPWSHDEPEYNPLTQLLVNRGYAVFRPQFRGSTGYGRHYMLAAKGDFGDGRVQRDIEEGTRYLLARGIGNPDLSAIMGASFGGYSTLQALSNGSRLYKVGIAVVPPADFGWTSRWTATRGDIGKAQGMSLDQSLRLLGLAPDNPAIARRLHRESPVARVAAMRTPLLIIASGRDERVPIRSVIDYAAQLKSRDAPVRIVVARGQPHSPSDPMASRSYLFLTETMLQRHLGGNPSRPPAHDVQMWMAGNLVG